MTIICSSNFPLFLFPPSNLASFLSFFNKEGCPNFFEYLTIFLSMCSCLSHEHNVFSLLLLPPIILLRSCTLLYQTRSFYTVTLVYGVEKLHNYLLPVKKCRLNVPSFPAHFWTLTRQRKPMCK